MAPFLVETGWEVSILMEDCDENHHRIQLECPPEVKVYYFDKSPALKEIKAKNKLINDIDPDVVFLCAFVARNIVGIGHRCKKVVEHSELLSAIQDQGLFRRLFSLITEYGSVLYSDAIINASKYLQKVFEKRSSLVFLRRPNLYLPYAYTPDKKVVVELPKEVKNIIKGRKVFAFLGNLTRNYGAFTMIEAIEKLKETHTDILLMLLGRGRDYEEARAYVTSHDLDNWVFMPGFVPEEQISEYLVKADYFISPMNDTVQDWARCPSKLYMYLTYRKPIVTCRIGEPCEVLGEEGVYYKPGDVEDMCSVIHSLILSGKTSINISTEMHTWRTRTKEFDKWVSSVFVI